MTGRPGVAVGHLRLHTADLAAARAFYEVLGMRPCMAWDGMAILELRGGTHLLLVQSQDEIQPILDAPFDLMSDDLDALRRRLARDGYEVSDIATHPTIGHRRFFVMDTDGRRIAVHSDHTEGRTV